MIKRRWGALYFLLFFPLFGGNFVFGVEIASKSSLTPAQQNEVVAVVGDKNITRGDFEKELESLNSQTRAQFETPEGRKQFLKELIEISILEQAALKSGIAEKAESAQPLKETTTLMLSQAYLKDMISKETVSDKDVEAYYNEHKKEFCEPDRYHLHQISYKDKDSAKKGKSEIDSGKSFLEISKADSTDGFKNSGGDRGFVTLDTLIPSLAAAVSTLKVNEVSEPIDCGASGSLLIKFSEKQEGSQQELSKVESSIKRQLTSDLPKKTVDRLMEGLEKEFAFKLEPSNVELLRNPDLSEKDFEKTLFSIGTESVKISAILPELERIPPFIRGHILSGNGLGDFVKQFSFREILKRFVEKKFDELAKSFPDTIAKAKQQVGIKSFLNDHIGKSVTVSEDEIKGYYSKNLGEFTQPEQFHAHHILVEQEDKAKTLLDRINKGEKFDDIAKTESKCPSNKEGGDLGFFGKGQMVPEFEEVVSKSAVGSVVGPIKTKFGFHIIRVDEKKAPGTQALEEVKDRIKSQLLPEKQRAAFEHLLEELRKTCSIKEFSDKL
ncbi:peptidyl-prolyl cis-trans isomerase [bacterium]|nr:peptidyl-prolyl cis-trans isomerase [bacterium]